MVMTSNEEFAKRMMLFAKNAEQFRPTATYDPDGDCIEFLAKPDPFRTERFDDLVTVYNSQETGEIIGSLINCGLLPKIPRRSRRSPTAS